GAAAAGLAGRLLVGGGLGAGRGVLQEGGGMAFAAIRVAQDGGGALGRQGRRLRRRSLDGSRGIPVAALGAGRTVVPTLAVIAVAPAVAAAAAFAVLVTVLVARLVVAATFETLAARLALAVVAGTLITVPIVAIAIAIPVASLRTV